ncbi:MAG: SDR family NAD(P)-dependent oxidoreductase [Solirubrobacteraceae bacterium]
MVTGAGRGLGSALALGLAREGADVAVHYHRSAAGAERVAAQVTGLGRRAVTVQADITRLDEVERMVAGGFEALGRIDVLVNNVGDAAPEQQSWRELDEPLIDRVLLTDVKGTLLVTHAVGRRMLEQRAGTIVNVCSNVVVTGSPRAPQYAASKHGVIGLTKSYAAAFAPHVRVNALGPGFIETETTLAREDWQSGRREEILARTPLQRIPKPEDIVAPIVFLACEDSAHLTGAFLVYDGGFSMLGA